MDGRTGGTSECPKETSSSFTLCDAFVRLPSDLPTHNLVGVSRVCIASGWDGSFVRPRGVKIACPGSGDCSWEGKKR
ncbi:unnamed protein product [Protopolystoma xenopodis]|uniref:Uncharacterized protein n=1 Tax=Protopolystoma xenopodis TaxID=117903 RepID=A0A448XR40_9PLAT|nr:unnamed protein product [Protopolystoma xenopodis]